MATVQRDVILDAPTEEVWEAISDEAMLSEWLAPDLELDLAEGGRLLCRTEDGERRSGTVLLIDERERLVFDWGREGSGPSRVEFRLEEVEGGTRLTVTETELQASAAADASQGWRRRLEALRLAIGSLAYA
jgi:uncharacterized protein YndB with AHSA1/START domain